MNAIRLYSLNAFNIETDELAKAQNIEKSIYNSTIQYCTNKDIELDWQNSLFSHIYKSKVSTILNEMKTNTDFVTRINNKTIQTKDIGYLKYNEFSSEKINLVDTKVEDGIFQCSKCSSKKTTYYSLQTRSADEPMTNFITCTQCKHRWKM